jgi:hypothetical protein
MNQQRNEFDTHEGNEERKIKNLIESTWQRIKWVIYIGIIVVAITSSYQLEKDSYSFSQVISSIGCGILLGGASLAGGGFLGFIFGIPSLLQNQNLNESRATTFKYNDNLVQISDWLTKIIVGVGLTQLDKIPDKVVRLGELFKNNFGGGEWGRNASLAIIFYFLLFGFLIIYFWTRTDFTSIMKKTDDEINKVKDENIKVKEENEKIKDQIALTKSKETIERNDLASDLHSIHVLENNENKQALDSLKTKVQDELKKRDITVKDDLQKNRWGGVSVKNGKKVSADVTPNTWQNFYDVKITVSSVSNEKLNVPVAIFIHDTYQYPDNVLYVNPDKDGLALLTLIAYEAFTIGVLFPDGTDLELDLNEQPGYPEGFYWKRDT